MFHVMSPFLVNEATRDLWASFTIKRSGRPLDNNTWQTEWKTAPLAQVQLSEYENQTLEAFVAVSCLYVKFRDLQNYINRSAEINGLQMHTPLCLQRSPKTFHMTAAPILWSAWHSLAIASV